MTWLGFILLAVPAAVALATTLYNLSIWPRGAPDRNLEGVSVLVPARNEIDTIEACLRAILESHVDEVVVCDDGSDDGTRGMVDALADAHSGLSVVETGRLPEGWVGKPNACRRLADEADGEILVFVDADTIVADDGLERLVSLLDVPDDRAAAMASAVPRQQVGSIAERLVLPLLYVTYTSWLPLSLVWRSSDPRFVAANGQLMALRRDALADIGGFSAVRDAVVDDVELAAAFKEAGHRVVFGDGLQMARCRMYDGFGELWDGFSKNIYEGLGESPFLLAGVSILYLSAFVLPYACVGAWLVGVVGTETGLAAAAGTACNVVLRGTLALTHDHPLEGPVTQPVGVLLLVAIAWNSMRRSRRGEIEWAGRTYESRASRGPAGESEP
ncbi:MAG: glycosyltransferase family 2 protein [Bradymonadaceae bacterium]